MIIIEERGHGTWASCGFSATLGGATQRVWPVEDLWLLTDSVLKFWLPDTKVEDVSLQVVLSPHNLQNIWFTSTSYVSHGKSFSQVRTNFRFDEEFSRIIACPLESRCFSCLIWTLLRWFSCFWGQKCRSNRRWSRRTENESCFGDLRLMRQDGGISGSNYVIWLAEFMIKNFEWQGKFIWDYFNLLCSLKMKNLSIMRA